MWNLLKPNFVEIRAFNSWVEYIRIYFMKCVKNMQNNTVDASDNCNKFGQRTLCAE